MKIYRVQDLANYNREVKLENGHVIKFDGHWADVKEEDIAHFVHVDDYQVGAATYVSTPEVKPEVKPAEVVSQPEVKVEQTTSPNLIQVTKPRDDTPKNEPVKVSETIKPRTAQK